MITEILIRCYNPELHDFQNKLCDLINTNTALKAYVIDHTIISIDDFDIGDSHPISLDRYLASKFNIEYMRVSRIFDHYGNVIARKTSIAELAEFRRPNICVIDTDIMSGETMRYACHCLQTSKYSVPVVMKKYQDLIDVEDLVYENSVLDNGTKCSYMINSAFFSRRTSLPIDLYDAVLDLIRNEEPFS